MSAQELDEEVRVSAYNPAWHETASRLTSQVAQSLTEIDSTIEHIGSTAVPGLDAKPVIDLMVGVEHQAKIDEAARKLVANGWKDFGEAGVAGRRYLRQRATDDCNVHIVLAGGEHWANNLALRDYLRSHPLRACDYAMAKRTALEVGHQRLLAYSAAKANTIAALLAEALTWSRDRP